ncbi:hypothetical protein BX666DRAFT_2031091 [Dichotomocladium elegans]|nr:hypothetical protein BX666DRAFT_2031091 [Dichotomocladium elegans]
MSINGSDTESSSLRSSQRRKGVIDTRRAEQNRAAQRAFRQRKERYVKELESKVCELQGLQERLEKLEEENTHLQQRLWELEHRPPVSAQVPAPPAPAPTPAAATPTEPFIVIRCTKSFYGVRVTAARTRTSSTTSPPSLPSIRFSILIATTRHILEQIHIQRASDTFV